VNPVRARERSFGLSYVHLLTYHTYMSKLTLSVDNRVVARAKRYAAKRGTSVSQLVEQYLDRVSRPAAADQDEVTPLLRQLRAELKGVSLDVREYQRYLERKYR
jgi:Family of unknown function (DUF6364)